MFRTLIPAAALALSAVVGLGAPALAENVSAVVRSGDHTVVIITPSDAREAATMRIATGAYELKGRRGHNSARVSQTGHGHAVAIRQSGRGNGVVVRQRGCRHSAQVTQIGRRNGLIVDQRGCGSDVVYDQHGVGNLGKLLVAPAPSYRLKHTR